ncbi:GNAT family N-acetyltransferase [Vibrio barjaei]|uniref:GNAT family N-acetyltransferase n=1 Tax=Vibrio barjaei TaxID=1676683 RepID=UPI0007BB427E|nr:GNAT family N-acetyltransferase [Vibrio barjaei]OIN24988.1 GNAT family N-acetyltransferase [Vibrio barjaei]
MKYTERIATKDDYDFLYLLKKRAEYQAVHTVFGWHEPLQQELHRQEWQQARPMVIEVQGERVGCYLFQNKEVDCYLGRFFLLPEFQGLGIGSQILRSCIKRAKSKPLTLCHLQGNKVHHLYKRHSFTTLREDEHFVYMKREPDEINDL